MKNGLRRSLALLTVLHMAATAVLAAPAESNLWEERRKARAPQLASAAPAPLSFIGGMPSARPVAVLAPRAAAPAVAALGGNLSAVAAALPLTHVSIREAHAASGGPVVALVQDIHLNPEAQGNIAEALDRLFAGGLVQRVGVEGAFEKFDFTRLHGFTDPALVRGVAQDFLKAGLLAAPSFAGAVRRGAGVETIGVDDRAAYDANVAAHARAKAAEPAVEKALSALAARLAALKTKNFTPALAALDGIVEAHAKGDIGAGIYMKRLAAAAGRAPSATRAFLEAYELEQTIDFNRADAERRRLIERLAGAMKPAELEALLQRTLAYRAGSVTVSAFHQELRDLCRRKGVDLAAHPAFDAYVRYVALAEGIKAEALAADQRALEKEAFAALATTPQQKSLVEVTRDLRLIRGLSRFSLTPDEWDAYRSRGVSFEKAQAALAALDGGSNEPASLADHEAFYRLADERSESIARNLLAGRPKAAALVVGGFHTPHLVEAFKKQGCAVLVVSPKLTKVDLASGSAYLTIFSRERTPIEKLFRGERLFINPTVVNVGSAPELERQMVAEGAARLAEGESTGAVPAGVTLERRGALARVVIDGMTVFFGRVQRAAGFVRVGDRVGRDGSQFVEAASALNRLSERWSAMREALTSRRAGTAAVSLLSLASLGAKGGDPISTLVAVALVVGIVVGAVALVRLFRSEPSVFRLLRAAREGRGMELPNALRYQLGRALDGSQRSLLAEKTVMHNRTADGLVALAAESELVILELEPGENGAIVSPGHTICTSIQIRSIHPVTGRVLLAHAHVRPDPDHIDQVRDALDEVRRQAEERGYEDAEVVVNWSPEPAVSHRLDADAAQRRLRAAFARAQGAGEFRFFVRETETREAGAIAAAVTPAGAFRLQTPFSTVSDRGVKVRQRETAWRKVQRTLTPSAEVAAALSLFAGDVMDVLRDDLSRVAEFLNEGRPAPLENLRRWRMGPTEEGKSIWWESGNLASSYNQDSLVIEAKEGDLVVFEPAWGQKAAIVSANHLTCTSIQMRAQSADGRILIGHAHIKPRPNHLTLARDAMRLFAEEARARGYAGAEVVVNWNPSGAVTPSGANTAARERTNADILSAVQEAQGDAFRFTLRAIEERIGMMNSAVTTVGALRDDRGEFGAENEEGRRTGNRWGEGRDLLAEAAGLVDRAASADDAPPAAPPTAVASASAPQAPRPSILRRIVRGAIWGAAAGLVVSVAGLPFSTWAVVAISSGFTAVWSAIFLPVVQTRAAATPGVLMMPSYTVLPTAAQLASANHLVLSPAYFEGDQLRASIAEVWRAGYLDRVIYINDGSTDLAVLNDLKANGLPGLSPEENDRFKNSLFYVSFDTNQRKERAIRSTLEFLVDRFGESGLPLVTIIQDSDSNLTGRGVRDQLTRASASLLSGGYAAMSVPIEGALTRDSGIVAWSEALGWTLTAAGKRLHEWLDRLLPALGLGSMRGVPGGAGFFRTDILRVAFQRQSGNFESGDLELASHVSDVARERNPNQQPVAPMFSGVRLRTDVMGRLRPVFTQKTRWFSAVFDADPAVYAAMLALMTWPMLGAAGTVGFYAYAFMVAAAFVFASVARLLNGAVRSMNPLVMATGALGLIGGVVLSFVDPTGVFKYAFGGLIAFGAVGWLRRSPQRISVLSHMTWAIVPFFAVVTVGIYIVALYASIVTGLQRRAAQRRASSPGSGASLTMPLWSWILSRSAVLRVLNPALAAAPAQERAAWASGVTGRLWFRSGVVPLLEFVGLPGFTMMLGPVVGLGWAVILGAVLFTLLHGLPSSAPNASPYARQGWGAFLLRLGVSTLLLAAAFQPDLIVSVLQLTGVNVPSAVSSWALANPLGIVIGGHALWNAFAPPFARLFLGAPNASPLGRAVARPAGPFSRRTALSLPERVVRAASGLFRRGALRGMAASAGEFVVNAASKERYLKHLHHTRHTIGADSTEFRATHAAVRDLVDKLLRAQGIDPSEFRFFLVDMTEVNAFILRDHDTIFMNLGLIKRVLDAGAPLDAVAFVVAHEIVHIKQGRDDILAGKKPVQTAADWIREESRDYADEYDADLRALELMDRAGISVRHAPTLFRLLLERLDSHMGWTHPAMEDRVRRLDEAIREPFYSNYAAAETPFTDEVAGELDQRSRHRRLQEGLRDFGMSADELIAVLESAQTLEELTGAMMRGVTYSRDARVYGKVDRVKAAFEARLNALSPDSRAGRAMANALRLTMYRALSSVSFPGLAGTETSEQVDTRRGERDRLTRETTATIDALLAGLSAEDLFDLLSLEVIGNDALDIGYYTDADRAAQEKYGRFQSEFYGERRFESSPSAIQRAIGVGETQYVTRVGLYESLADGAARRLLAGSPDFAALVRLSALLREREAELKLRVGSYTSMSSTLPALKSDVLSQVAALLPSQPPADLSRVAGELMDIFADVRSDIFDARVDFGPLAAAIYDAARVSPAVAQALRERLAAGAFSYEFRRLFAERERDAIPTGPVLIQSESLADQLAESRALFDTDASQTVEALVAALIARDGPTAYLDALTPIVARGEQEGELAWYGTTRSVDSVLWDRLRSDYSAETTARIEARLAAIERETGLAGLTGLSDDLKRLVFFHDAGGILSTTDLGYLLNVGTADDQFSLVISFLRTLGSRPRQARMTDTRTFNVRDWDEHLLRFGLAAFRRATGGASSVLPRYENMFALEAVDGWPGELSQTGSNSFEMEFERGLGADDFMQGRGFFGQFVNRARRAKPYSINRMMLMDITPEAFLDQFNWMFAGQTDFRAALNRAVGFLPPSPFRNVALYVLFHRLLASRGIRVPAAEWFDQAAMARRLDPILSDPARETDARIVRAAIGQILPHLVADARIETFNRNLIAGSLGIDADVVPAGHDARSRRFPDIRGYTPGGAGTQIDLLLASFVDREVRAATGRGSFEARLRALTTAYRRPSAPRDRFLDQLAGGPGVTPDQIASLLPLYGDRASMERTALIGLEAARKASPDAFATLDGELAEVLRFFPNLSPMRDDILRQIVDEKAKNPEELARLEALMLRHNNNLRDGNSAQVLRAEDTFREAVRNAEASDKRLFLLWLFSMGAKPDFMKAIEAKHGFNFDGLRESYARRVGDHYRDAGRRTRDDFLKTLLYGEKGLLTVETERRAFVAELFDSVVPAGATADTAMRNLLRKAFLTAFEKAGQYQREETLLELLDNLAAPATGARPTLSEPVAMRIFLQSLGLVGVKVGQFIASSGFASPELKAELENLKDRARPIYKGIVFGMIAKVFNSFSDRFTEITQLLGSASIKVVYKAVFDGRVVTLKVKRPDVEKQISSDMAFLREVFAEISADFAAAGINVPANIVDIIERGVRRELDFDREAESQRVIGGNMATRAVGWVAGLFARLMGRGRTVIRIADPEATEVFANNLMVETFVDGVSLKDFSKMPGNAAAARRIKLDLALELFRQIFIDGVYHADLHDGNVIIRFDGAAYLIDLGAVERISPRNRQILFNLFKAIARKDSRRTLDVLAAAFPRDVAKVRRQGAAVSEIINESDNAAAAVFDVWSQLLRSGVTVSDELLAINVAIGKASYLFEDAGRADAAAFVFAGTTRETRRPTLVLPFWSWLFSRAAVLRAVGSPLAAADEASRRAAADALVSGFWFRSVAAPLAELALLPGLTVALSPLLGVAAAVAAGALLFALLHGIPSRQAGPFRQGWGAFAARFAWSYLLLAVAFQPDLIVAGLNAVGIPVPPGALSALASHPMAFVLGGHALWNALVGGRRSPSRTAAERNADAIVSGLVARDPARAIGAVVTAVADGALPDLNVGETTQTDRPVAAFDPLPLARALGERLDAAARAGSLSAAEAERGAALVAALLAAAGRGAVNDALISIDAVPVANDGRQDLELFRWLAPGRDAAAAEAERLAGQWARGARRAGDTLTLLASGNASALETALRTRYPDLGTSLRVLDATAFAGVGEVLKVTGGLDPQRFEGRQFRFVARHDVGLAPGFFDLSAAGLPAASAAALQRNIEIFLIVNAIAQAVRIDGSLLPSFEAIRTVMIQA